MAYTFTSTGSRIAYRSLSLPGTLTLMGWLKFNATSSATTPQWFGHSATRLAAGMINSRADHYFQRNWTSNAQWRVTAANGGVSYTDWHFVCWRYDSGSTANDPTCWMGNLSTVPTSRTVTEQTAPSGTLTTLAGTAIVGNRGDADSANWGAGSIGWISYHSAILTDAEVLEAWAYGWSSRSLGSSLLLLDLIGDSANRSGVVDSGTVSSATVVNGPGIAPRGLWTPRGGSRQFSLPAAGGGADVTIAATIAATSTVAAVVRRRRLIAPLVAATSSVSVSVVRRRAVAPTIAATSTVTAVARKQDKAIAAGISAVSTVSVSVRRVRRVSPAIASASAVAAAPRRRRRVAPGVFATSAVTVAARKAPKTAAPTVAVTSTVTVSVRRRRRVAPAVTGSSTLAAAVRRRRRLAVAVAATSTVSITPEGVSTYEPPVLAIARRP